MHYAREPVDLSPTEDAPRKGVLAVAQPDEWATQSTSALLRALRDPCNASAWREFNDRYGRVIRNFARHVGQDTQAAEDTVQDTFVVFLAKFREGGFNRERGRLRSWLFRIAQNKVRDWHRRHRKEVQMPEGSGTGFLEQIPESVAEQWWEAEWRKALLRKALQLVEPEFEPDTIETFKLCVLNGKPASEVAGKLGVEVGVVYTRKCRVAKRVREWFKELDEES